VQLLPTNTNYAALLGFAGGPGVDEGELRRGYYDLSRRLHPDRFQTGTPEEQRASVQATALLNTAYTTLKDVESRGRWWLERIGDSLSRDNRQVPPGLAALVFDVQETIAQRAGCPDAERGALDTELRRSRDELAERRSKERKKVEALLTGWPREGDTNAARAELKRALSELSYLRTLARDVQSALED